MRTCPQCQNPCEETHKFCPSCGFPVAKVAQQTDDPLIGRTLPGGYVILDLVGIGGMGRVYRAEQTNLGRTVAVKIIHPHLVGEENAAARFITEARAASRLNHPNSVGVIDFGKTEDGQLYLVMEFLRGKDLARVEYEEGPLSFRRIVSILRQVLAALSEAHHLEIIHRDLKPENIILEPVRTGGDFVKVVDFGLAKMREGSGPNITSPGIVCGTPEYMSPEQGRGDPLDPRSDLYAVGVIFYQLLTGRLPFEAESPTQVVLMHITEPAPDPRAAAPERKIPSLLADVCLMALAKEPPHRFGNADEFAEALADALTQIESTVPRPLTAAATIRCPKCGAGNTASQKFCGECGTTLQAAPAAANGTPLAPTLSPPLAESEPPPPPNMTPIEPGTGQREILVDRDRAQFPLEFVGRDDDLLWLDDRLVDAKSSLVGARIVGDVGMGKTRLLHEFLAKVRVGGHSVVEVTPDPGWAEVGYYAVRHAIVALTGLPANGGSAQEWTSTSAEARRGLADIFEHPNRGELSPDELRFAVAEALRWAIVRASERSGGETVVLAVDDLHAIDGASRTAFADAVGEPPLVPSVLVVTYPPGHDPGWPASIASARVLMGLAPGMVSRLLAGTSRPSSSIGGRGIAPLYVDQLLRFSREQGGRAPTRLADLIALRVERLAPDARRVLQAIAVYGDAADEAIVQRLVTVGTKLADATAVLLDAGMIAPAREGATAAPTRSSATSCSRPSPPPSAVASTATAPSSAKRTAWRSRLARCTSTAPRTPSRRSSCSSRSRAGPRCAAISAAPSPRSAVASTSRAASSSAASSTTRCARCSSSRASSARRSPPPGSSPTPRACSARRSTWPVRAAPIARGCSVRSRRSRPSGTATTKRIATCSRPSSWRSPPARMSSCTRSRT
jgi:serine/threonine protein kinase